MKFSRLEAIRGFTSLYVCIAHLFGPSLPAPARLALSFGQEAVIVFFVLSGFVIHWTSSKSPEPSFAGYFVRRFARIYSVWFLLVPALFVIASLEAGRPVLESPWRLVGNFFMLQDNRRLKPAVWCDAMYGDTPLWSLHYEWWFYMLYPATRRLGSIARATHVVGTCGVAAAAAYAILPNVPCRLAVYFCVWWIGVVAAESLRRTNGITIRDVAAPLAYVAGAALPLGALCLRSLSGEQTPALGAHPFLETRHLIAAIVLVCLAFLWRRLGWCGFPLVCGWCAVVAPISFSLYAIHWRSLVLATYLRGCLPEPLEYAAYATLTVGFCLVAEVWAYPHVRRALDRLPMSRLSS